MKNDKLLVVSSYPENGKTHGKKTVGVASYTKNTLDAICNVKKTDITVLAEKFEGEDNFYTDSEIKVKRVWKRNSVFTFFLILSEIIKNHKDTKNVLVELELAMFGNQIYLIPLPFFLLVLKILNKNVTIVIHQVISDIQELSGHISIYKPGFKTTLLNLYIKVFYFLILLFSNKAIVFDEILAERLHKLGNKNKIVVIPHGVEDFKNNINKDLAKLKLKIPKNNFVILYFGYLAWYKGIDWLLNEFSKIPENKRKNITLLIAGGKNPNHLDKSSYEVFIEKVEKEAKNKSIILSGYVKQEEIPLYFQACDVVVLPYRTLMSASGPLSIAISFKKPFLVSEKLKQIFDTKDIKEIIESLKINKNDLIFPLNSSFYQKVEAIKNNPSLQDGIKRLTMSLYNSRSWKNIGIKYYNELLAK